MSVASPGFSNQNATSGAEQARRAIFSGLSRGASIGSVLGGIIGAGDCAISASAGGPPPKISVAAGELIIPGSASGQGGYYGRVTAAEALNLSTADVTNPRIE